MVVVPPRPTPPRPLLSRLMGGRPPGLLADLRSRITAWLRWVGIGRIVVTAVAVVVTVIGGIWLIRTPDPEMIHEAALAEARSATYTPVVPTEYTLIPAPTLPAANGPERNNPAHTDPPVISPVTSPVIVHVVGAVRAPGVYTLASDARVIDAVRAAGGPTDQAQLDAMNLASQIFDGQRLMVPTLAEVRAGSYQAPAEARPPGSPPASGTSGTSGTSGGSASGGSQININTAGEEELTRLHGVGPATAAAIIADRTERGPFTSVDDLIRVRGIGPAKLAALRPQARI